MKRAAPLGSIGNVLLPACGSDLQWRSKQQSGRGRSRLWGQGGPRRDGQEHVHADIYAKTAEEARRAALEAVEAERRQMMAEIEERRQEARKEALEEHTRLMGLAGTPGSVQRPTWRSSTTSSASSRTGGFWRPKEAFRTERDAALDARTQEVLAENARLKEQVTRLSASVRQLQRIRDIWQETVQAVTGSAVAARVLDQVKALWAKDRANPAREADPAPPPPRRQSSGPSM